MSSNDSRNAGDERDRLGRAHGSVLGADALSSFEGLAGAVLGLCDACPYLECTVAIHDAEEGRHSVRPHHGEARLMSLHQRTENAGMGASRGPRCMGI